MSAFGKASTAASGNGSLLLWVDCGSKPRVTERRHHLVNAFDRELARLLSSACK
jgi:hypothetical protein